MQHALPTASYPVLDALPAPARATLQAAAQWMKVAAGQVVFDDHQPCEGFPFVVEGSIRVVKCAPSGRELPLYRVAAGVTCVISSSCLLGGTDYNARGVAETDTVLMLLPRQVFDTLLGEAAFRSFVFHLFAERIAGLMQLIEEVAFHRLDQRLATLLLGKGRVLHVTHQKLADELGSVREIVSRLLKGFAAAGLVRLGREQIEILDPAGTRLGMVVIPGRSNRGFESGNEYWRFDETALLNVSRLPSLSFAVLAAGDWDEPLVVEALGWRPAHREVAWVHPAKAVWTPQDVEHPPVVDGGTYFGNATLGGLIIQYASKRSASLTWFKLTEGDFMQMEDGALFEREEAPPTDGSWWQGSIEP